MRDRWYVVGAVTIAVLAAVIGAVSYGTAPVGQRDHHTSLDAATQVDQLHDAGIAGANVSVGVVDVTGFRDDEDGESERSRAHATASMGALEGCSVACGS